MTLTFQANSDDEELDELELRRIALASAIPRMEDQSQLPDDTFSHDVSVHSASEESDKSAYKGKVDENNKPRSSNYQASRRIVASREAARRRHHSVEGGYYWWYCKICVKRPFSKGPKIGFQDQLSFNAGQKYCRMLQGEHSAILSTFIQLPFVIKICVLSIFEWLFYTGFTVF